MRTKLKPAMVGTAIAALALCGTPQARAQYISAKMRAEDKRLSGVVTLKSERIRVAELLQRLSSDTGVPLSMDDRTTASGIVVAVAISKTPLASVMNALASFASCRGYMWEWSQESGTGRAEAGYRLRAPDAGKMAGAWRVRSQTAFEEQAAFLTQMGQLSDDKERERLIGKTTNKAARLVAGDNSVLKGNAMFATALTSEQQLAVLRGQEVITVPLTSLSPDARAFIAEDARLSQRPDLLSDKVKFYVKRSPRDPSPTLHIDWGYGAYGYVGGVPLESQITDEIESAWIRAGDSREDPALTRGIPAGVSSLANTSADGAESLQGRMMQLAIGAGLSVITIVPERPDGFPSPAGQTVAQFLGSLRKSPRWVLTKWRDGLLVVNYAGWFLEANDYLPWRAVEQLRSALSLSGDGPNLKAIAKLTWGFNDPALQRLRRDVPRIEMVQHLRDAFGLLYGFPRIETDREPVVMTDDMRLMLQQFTTLPASVLRSMKRVRMYKVIDPGATPSCREIRFELYGGLQPLVRTYRLDAKP